MQSYAAVFAPDARVDNCTKMPSSGLVAGTQYPNVHPRDLFEHYPAPLEGNNLLHAAAHYSNPELFDRNNKHRDAAHQQKFPTLEQSLRRARLYYAAEHGLNDVTFGDHFRHCRKSNGVRTILKPVPSAGPTLPSNPTIAQMQNARHGPSWFRHFHTLSSTVPSYQLSRLITNSDYSQAHYLRIAGLYNEAYKKWGATGDRNERYTVQATAMAAAGQINQALHANPITNNNNNVVALANKVNKRKVSKRVTGKASTRPGDSNAMLSSSAASSQGMNDQPASFVAPHVKLALQRKAMWLEKKPNRFVNIGFMADLVWDAETDEVHGHETPKTMHDYEAFCNTYTKHIPYTYTQFNLFVAWTIKRFLAFVEDKKDTSEAGTFLESMQYALEHIDKLMKVMKKEKSKKEAKGGFGG